MATITIEGGKELSELLKKIGKDLPFAINQVLAKEANLFRTKVIERIDTQNLGPNTALSTATILARQAQGFNGTKALIRTGTMRQSITVTKKGKAYFVGLLRSAVSSDGKSYANIGAVHEFGAGVVPARPFLRPTLQEAINGAKKRIERNLGIALKGKLGRV